jgi:2OG-Fe(II) oxygenase superfamily
MRLVLKDEHLTVIDDLLPSDDFRRFYQALQFTDYTLLQGKSWNKAYGAPGPTILESQLVVRGQREITPPGLSHVGQVMDLLAGADSPLRRLYAAGETASDHTITGRVILFGRGAGLRWHADASDQIGAYIYYGHPEWHTSWGGELMIMDGATKLGHGLTEKAAGSFGKRANVKVGGLIGPDFQLDGAEERRADNGLGRFIMAKPNRLVVLSGSAEHRVAPVTDSAGDHLRCSLTGFVVKQRSSA